MQFNSILLNFFQNKFNSCSTNSDTFRVIRNFTGQKSKSQLNGALAMDANKTHFVTGNIAIANSLAECFYVNHLLTHNHKANDIRSHESTLKFSSDISGNNLTKDELSATN